MKNPSYPTRVHCHEKAGFEKLQREAREKVAACARKLATLSTHPRRGEYERLYLQMQGALDQMAECARRMPLETGVLYDEDHERMNAAQEALNRVLERWAAVKA